MCREVCSKKIKLNLRDLVLDFPLSILISWTVKDGSIEGNQHRKEKRTVVGIERKLEQVIKSKDQK
jgi:hypothetical protein